MTNFFEEIKNEPPKLTHKSHFRKVYESLPEDERDDFVKAVHDHSIPIASIMRVLAKRGIVISRSSLTRARNGEILDDVQ